MKGFQMKNRLRNTISVTLFIALLGVMLSVTSLDAGQESKRVFVLNSFNHGYTWTDNMQRGIDDTFGSSGITVNSYVTFMDMKRVDPSAQYFQKIKEMIREGYRGVRFDAVLACDNDAFEFIKKFRDELFPGVPVVFSSINDFDERMLEGRKDITGTSENTDYSGTIKAALKLFPVTKNIVIVTDDTTTGKAHRSAIEKIRPEFSQSATFNFISLADMTMDELAGKLSKLDRDSVVLLLQHFKDKNGTSYTVQESTPLLAKNSSVPVFVLTDIRMGLGVLGGHLVSGYHHGEAAAQMVLKILKGADVKTIPVLLDSPNKYMFDYSVMQRFKIAANDLPHGSILINKPVSLLDKYWPYLYAILGAFILLSSFVAFLLFEIRSRKKTEGFLKLSEASLQTTYDKLQEQYEELQMNEESLRDQNDELMSLEEMLRVQINEYEISRQQLKDREETLWKERAFLRSLIDSADDLIYFKDNNGIYLGCNRASEIFTGHSEQEQIGKSDCDLFDKEMAEQIVTNDRSVLDGGVALRTEEWVTSANGSRLLLDTVKTPIYGPDGQPIGLVGISRDITERKRIEEALQKRIVALTQPVESGNILFEELFNMDDVQRLQDKFAKATGVASIITQTDGTPITEPSNFTRLCNDIIRKTEKGCAACYRSDAAIGCYNPDGPSIQPCLSGGLWDAGAGITVGGRHIANWLIGQVRDETQTEEKMAAYAREIGVNEASFIDAFREVPSMSREQFEQVAQALFTLANQLSTTAYQNIQQARFINELKQADETLRHEKTRAQSFLDTVETTIIALDVEGKIINVNRKGCQLLGYMEEELIGKNWFTFCLPQPDGVEKMYPVFLRLMAGERMGKEYQENPIITRRGELRQIVWHNSLLRDDQGVIIGALSAGDDITEMKRSEEERAKLEGQLQQSQKMESVGRLAGGVAHDFNNMLGVIIGHSELALMKLKPSHPIHASLTEIRIAAERSADLTRQLLAFARKQTIAPRVIDLNDTITGMLKMLRRLIGENINLILQTTSNLWPVKLDPSQIDQMLANLCVNARDAITDVGRITIETGNSTVDSGYSTSQSYVEPGEYVRLVVSDNGSGMDKETQAHIFEPFFTTKGVGVGTGLGLATVYGIVMQNNGFINVYSEPGQGTAFSIYLPRHAGEDGQALKEGATAPLPRGSETILLVEDEPTILDMAAMLLEGQGYTVLTAGTAVEAIGLFKEHGAKIKLLITDVVMPDMNGRDLAKELKSLKPELNCLFMSGYTADVIAHHGVLDEGVNFIQKPFSLPGLSNKVREVLDGK
jgi:PAS domain S-box-containing protein